MAISDATQLLAPGVDVVLSDGKTYILKFDWHAIQVIEDDLGGLDAAVDTLMAEGWKNRRVTAIGNLMAATLSHTKMKREQVLDLLDFKQIVTYLTALSEAFAQAMPMASETKADLPKVKGSDGDSPSPGNGSLRSPSVVASAPPGSLT
jgi:hypothetical protein